MKMMLLDMMEVIYIVMIMGDDGDDDGNGDVIPCGWNDIDPRLTCNLILL